MKKYITVAALLAAGTAFANAAEYNATEVWSIEFGSDYTGGYSITGTIENKGTFWDVIPVVGGTGTGSDKRVHMAGGVYGSWDDDFQIDIELTLGNPITASNDWPVFAEVSGNGTAVRFGPYVGTGGNNTVGIDGGGAFSKEEDATRMVSVASEGSYTVTLLKIGDDISVYVDGTLSASGKLADTLTGNITDIALGGNTGSNYRINETVHSISYSTLTAIPEPSAFGLLAGIGALALVASRRRKRA